MIKIVLAESELELVPDSIRGHPSLKRQVRGKDAVLLDSNYHHRAMGRLDDSYRRGRPDIAHVCLLSAMESPLNKSGGVEFYIHTRNNDVIFMDSSWKVPKSYNRFVGLMEKLFVEKSIMAGDVELLRMETMDLVSLIESIRDGMDVSVMHYQGKDYVPSEDGVVVVGGFPHGDFTTSLPYPKYTIFKEELVAWAVVNTVVYSKIM